MNYSDDSSVDSSTTGSKPSDGPLHPKFGDRSSVSRSFQKGSIDHLVNEEEDKPIVLVDKKRAQEEKRRKLNFMDIAFLTCPDN